MSAAEKKKEDWMNSKWRPACGWLYMGICFFDFVMFPILWSSLQAVFHGGVNIQWQPLTLQGAGLLHLSFGAIIGVTAWGRTQEKLNGANNGGTTYTPPAPIQPTVPTTVVTPVPVAAPTPAATPAPSFGTPAPVFASSSGKLAPTQPDFPER